MMVWVRKRVDEDGFEGLQLDEIWVKWMGSDVWVGKVIEILE